MNSFADQWPLELDPHTFLGEIRLKALPLIHTFEASRFSSFPPQGSLTPFPYSINPPSWDHLPHLPIQGILK